MVIFLVLENYKGTWSLQFVHDRNHAAQRSIVQQDATIKKQIVGALPFMSKIICVSYLDPNCEVLDWFVIDNVEALPLICI